MNLREMLDFHIKKKAEMTLACTPSYGKERLSEFGIVKLGKNNRITDFIEKPTDEKRMQDAITKIDGKEAFLISMGIYIFNKETLVEILTESTKVDFGKEIIPDSFSRKKTEAFIYKGYWRDIGSIKTFYEENLILTEAVPPIDLFDENWQMFTRPRYLPPLKVGNGHITKSIISEGCIIESATIKHSAVGVRSRIEERTLVEDSIIMGSDFYQPLGELLADKKKGKPIMGIGKNCIIKKAILDKNVKIGDGVKIVNERKLESFEGKNFTIKDGIVIIHKNATIKPDTVI